MDIEAEEKGWILKGQQTDRDPMYMKIAQVCPLYESCPPRFYGGTERIVSHLTEELVQRFRIPASMDHAAVSI
jgi:hypothetical protein